MKAKKLCSMFFVVVMLETASLDLSARTLGMLADADTHSVTVFDGDTHAILGTVPIPIMLMETLKRFREAGIRTQATISPLMPLADPQTFARALDGRLRPCGEAREDTMERNRTLF